MHIHRTAKPRHLACILMAALGMHALPAAQAAESTCVPNELLVNPCRPWLGATAGEYPGVGDHLWDWEAQVLDHERRIGRKLDIVHSYAGPGKPPLSSEDLAFLNRGNTIVFATWKPASRWADAGGRNATVNASIDKLADNIKAVAPRKVMLSIHHEPENDVIPGSGASGCALENYNTARNKDGSYEARTGSAAEYKAMWRNVYNRLQAKGVTNAVWVVNYMGFSKYNCMIDDLWPGNDIVDWVMWDPYSEKSSWDEMISPFYNTLLALSNTQNDYASKAWGLAEWGAWKESTRQHTYQLYDQAAEALSANTYPRIRAYTVFDYGGARVAYDAAGVRDEVEQGLYTILANHPAFTNPVIKNGWDVERPSVALTGITEGAQVSGTVALSATASDNRKVNRVSFRINGKWLATDTAAPYSASWNTAGLPSGTYAITANAFDDAGNVSVSTRTVVVK